jgi:hypothetical protein
MFSPSGVAKDRFDIVLMITVVHNCSRCDFQYTLTPSANSLSRFVDDRHVVEASFSIQLINALKSSPIPIGVQDCLPMDVEWQLTLYSSLIDLVVTAVTLRRLIKCFGFGKLGKERRLRLLNGSRSNVRVLLS